MITKVCEHCGKEFEDKLCRNRKYHGRECFWAARRRRGKAICIQCKKPFMQRHWKQKLCTKPCANEYQRRTMKACHTCGKRIPKHRKFCDASCRLKDKDWDRTITPKGYIEVWLPKEPGLPRKKIYEHRLVMENHLGRKLLPNEWIHHRDQDKANNRLSNLEIVSNGSHRGTIICRHCGGENVLH